MPDLASQVPALVLHEGISTPEPQEAPEAAPSEREWTCSRWPKELRLQAGAQLVPGRCKSTNLCSYCARLAAVENTEMLALDAMLGEPPAVWAVLTTRSTDPDPARYYRSREKLQRAWRRRFPNCEVAWLLEFTTGYGLNSGGERRPHWNALIKGVPDTDEARAQLLDAIDAVWCAREDAERQAQHVGSVYAEGGLMRYLALHFQKESQSPPAGWRGHRFTATRGYLWMPTPDARQAARESLRFNRELWKLRQLYDVAGIDVEEGELLRQAEAAVELAGAVEWELVRLTKLPATWDDQGRPLTWTEEVFPVRTT